MPSSATRSASASHGLRWTCTRAFCHAGVLRSSGAGTHHRYFGRRAWPVNRHGWPCRRASSTFAVRRRRQTFTAQALLANIAAMYAAFHGPSGLRAIAERIHGLAVTLDGELRVLGYRQTNGTWLRGTLRIEGGFGGGPQSIAGRPDQFPPHARRCHRDFGRRDHHARRHRGHSVRV